jgi:hypothetical protein
MSHWFDFVFHVALNIVDGILTVRSRSSDFSRSERAINKTLQPATIGPDRPDSPAPGVPTASPATGDRPDGTGPRRDKRQILAHPKKGR